MNFKVLLQAVRRGIPVVRGPLDLVIDLHINQGLFCPPNMNPQDQPMNRERQEGLETSVEKTLRKMEFSFYFLFPMLAVVCFVLPPVYHLKYIAIYIAAVFSILYSFILYFIRYKLAVHYSLMLHSGLFLIFSSPICFSFGYNKDGVTLVTVGTLEISLIMVLSTLRKFINKTNRAGIERVRQRQDAQDRPNQPLEVDEDNNADLPNGQLNNLNIVLDNGNLVHFNEVLAHIPAIPNGHAVQAPDFPPNQQVEEANEQADQQIEEPGAPADNQMENPNEQIAPEQQE